LINRRKVNLPHQESDRDPTRSASCNRKIYCSNSLSVGQCIMQHWQRNQSSRYCLPGGEVNEDRPSFGTFTGSSTTWQRALARDITDWETLRKAITVSCVSGAIGCSGCSGKSPRAICVFRSQLRICGTHISWRARSRWCTESIEKSKSRATKAWI
jgi:hypothetical protein